MGKWGNGRMWKYKAGIYSIVDVADMKFGFELQHRSLSTCGEGEGG